MRSNDGRTSNLQAIISIILVEVAVVKIELHRAVIALNPDHLVGDERYVQAIAASVQFDEEHHHAGGEREFSLALIE